MRTAALLFAAALLQAQEPYSGTWNFGNGTSQPSDTWTPQTGFGFDFGTRPVRITGGVAGDKPFFFSVTVPEGNYRVTANLGDPDAACSTTIKAQSGLLTIEHAETDAGRTRQVAFAVNVHGAGKLTLEFNGRHACLDALEIRQASDVITVYVMGDSMPGWGQMLARFFKPEVAIANRARLGASEVRPGDYVLIPFSGNYMKAVLLEARGKSAVPVLVGGVSEALRRTAAEERFPIIDLNSMSVLFYKALDKTLGPKRSRLARLSDYGAYELAKCVVEGIRANNLPLAKYLTDDCKPFDPAHPDPPESSEPPASPAH